MAGSDALAAALAMLERPQTARLVQLTRLPSGVTLLLEIAASETQALKGAARLTGRSEATLEKAAGFFIEQVLLHPGGDSYRILGGTRESPAGELRRHMALLMRWLHPDMASNKPSETHLNRSLFANRIIQAWETVKTEERRAAYNVALAIKCSAPRQQQDTKTGIRKLAKPRQTCSGLSRSHKPARQLVLQPLKSAGFWSRLRLFLGGR